MHAGEASLLRLLYCFLRRDAKQKAAETTDLGQDLYEGGGGGQLRVGTWFNISSGKTAPPHRPLVKSPRTNHLSLGKCASSHKNNRPSQIIVREDLSINLHQRDVHRTSNTPKHRRPFPPSTTTDLSDPAPQDESRICFPHDDSPSLRIEALFPSQAIGVP